MFMDNRAIGVFDSGMGGISVLAKALQILPNEKYLYYGDNAHAPYGTKSDVEIQSRCQQIVDFFVQKECKAILIACNTASGAAADFLRAKYSLPIISMVPALKPAYQAFPHGSIAVLATPLTLKLPKFQNLMEKYGENTFPLACPKLVECVEKNEMDTEVLEKWITYYLSDVEKQNLKAIVLGCTHFTFVKNKIQELYPHVQIIDGNTGTIRELARRIVPHEQSSSTPHYQIFSSTEDENLLFHMDTLLAKALEGKDYYQV